MGSHWLDLISLLIDCLFVSLHIIEEFVWKCLCEINVFCVCFVIAFLDPWQACIFIVRTAIKTAGTLNRHYFPTQIRTNPYFQIRINPYFQIRTNPYFSLNSFSQGLSDRYKAVLIIWFIFWFMNLKRRREITVIGTLRCSYSIPWLCSYYDQSPSKVVHYIENTVPFGTAMNSALYSSTGGPGSSLMISPVGPHTFLPAWDMRLEGGSQPNTDESWRMLMSHIAVSNEGKNVFLWLGLLC